MSSGQSDIDAVRDATDLVRLIGEHVALRPKGREHVGLCPFHDDKNPSMAIVTHKGNAFYKCHACGAGGDAFDFVMNYHRMDFAEALRLLADRAGITLKPLPRKNGAESGESRGSQRTDLKKANAFAATFFRRVLSDPTTGADAREVIQQRGISDEMVEAFMIGAAPDQWDGLAKRIRKQSLDERIFLAAGLLKPRKEDGSGNYDAFRNRLVFPICDELGNPIAFGARKINPEDEPKYLNSSESAVFAKSKTLYALNLAKRSIIESKQAIVTEGYTDVIACHQAGITNVVATLGTALTREHAQILGRLCDKVILLFDGDEAGQKAGNRGFEVLAEHFGLAAFFHEKIDVEVCVLPDELDPDELLKQPGGRHRFIEALNGSVGVLEFVIDRFRAQLANAVGMSGRQKQLETLLSQLANLGLGSIQGVRRGLILARLAELMGVRITDIEAAIPKARRAAERSENDTQPAGEAPVSPNLEGEQAGTSPARRRAEQELLAILIFQPDLHTAMIDSGAGSVSRLTDLFSSASFADPLMRIVAAEVLERLERGVNFTVQQLLSSIDQPHVKAVIPNLYFDGERLCEAPPADPLTSLQTAARSLRAHMNLEQYNQTVRSYRQCRDAPQEALLAAQSVIEQRRRQDNMPWAIARGVRS